MAGLPATSAFGKRCADGAFLKLNAGMELSCETMRTRRGCRRMALWLAVANEEGGLKKNRRADDEGLIMRGTALR